MCDKFSYFFLGGFLKRKLFFPVLILFFTGFYANAQIENDSVPPVKKIKIDTSAYVIEADTTAQPVEQPKKERKGFFSGDYPNPRKAALLSIIPGGGQIYNKKWWYVKVPVIYGGLIGVGLVAEFNTRQYNELDDAYVAELNGQPHQYSDRNFSAATLKQFRDIYDKRRQQSYIGLTAIYIAGILEAYVSAHLLQFDVSDDLSFRFNPKFGNTPLGQAYTGLGLSLEF